MGRLLRVRDFEHHHAAILVFLLVASAFFINVFAFQAAYESVEQRAEGAIQPPRLDTTAITTESPSADTETGNEIEHVRLTGLDAKLIPILERYNASFGLAVQDLSTGEYLGINDSTTFVSASLYKLFVSYEVARQADLGLINLTDSTGFDAPERTITECLWDTLSYSDNPCGRALRKMIEADDAPSNAIAEAGFYGTALVNEYPTTSARDVSLFFSKLYNQSDFSAPINAKLLAPLQKQQVDNRIPQGLPSATQIAHKTADLDGYSHDGGIIYSPAGDYILVIMSGPWNNGYTESPAAHIEITQAVDLWFNETAVQF